ncbi:MAG: hypothetical protein P1P65_00735 [Treponema sp.]
MNSDIFESLEYRIESFYDRMNMLGVAVDEIEYDLSLIECFDVEMQLEELKSKIKTVRYRIIDISDEITICEVFEKDIEENLQEAIEVIEEEIKALEDYIEAIKKRYS